MDAGGTGWQGGVGTELDHGIGTRLYVVIVCRRRTRRFDRRAVNLDRVQPESSSRGNEKATNLLQPNNHLSHQHEAMPVIFTDVTIEGVTPSLPKDTQDKTRPTMGPALISRISKLAPTRREIQHVESGVWLVMSFPAPVRRSL